MWQPMDFASISDLCCNATTQLDRLVTFLVRTSSPSLRPIDAIAPAFHVAGRRGPSRREVQCRIVLKRPLAVVILSYIGSPRPIVLCTMRGRINQESASESKDSCQSRRPERIVE